MKRLIGCLFITWSTLAAGQNTPGTVSFTVKTVDNNKHFSPDHVMAIWIENEGGKFVKTLQVQAARRKQYLYTWNVKSGGNSVDAISGPTLPDHQSHTVVWNCKDTLGKVVRDGNYRIVTEFTSEHAQGPVQTVSFTKGAGAIKMNPANQPFFVDMNLVYTPANATGGVADQDFDFQILKPVNNRQLAMEIRMADAEQVVIDLCTSNGKLVERLFNGKWNKGNHLLKANLAFSKGTTKGNFVVVVASDRFVATRRVVI